MSRLPVESEINGLKVVSLPLPFPSAQPLIPEVAEIVSLALRHLGGMVSASGEVSLKTQDVLKLAPVLGELAAHLGAGRLERLAPKIMATTTVICEDVKGELQSYDLGKDKERNYVFDEHPGIYFQVLIFAGMVTFKRFFPASGRSVGSVPSSTP